MRIFSAKRLHGKLGFLSSLLLLCSAITEASTTIPFTVNPTLPSFNLTQADYTNGNLGGINNCGISDGLHYYDSVTFRANGSVSHLVATTALTGLGNDNFIAFYSGVFNPQAVTNGLIGCDDDSGPSTWAQFSSTLSTNQIYTGVVTSYGSGEQTGSGSYSVNPAVTLVYTVSGQVTGLTAGDSLVLENNAPSAMQPQSQLTITNSGSFTFPSVLDNTNSYTVSVLTQPAGKTCTLQNATGTVSSANIRNISVTCTVVQNALLSFDSQGGSAVTPLTVNFGATQVLPVAPQKANYSFNGWNTQANGNGITYQANSNFIMPSAATTLYAQWLLNSYSVTATIEGDGVVNPTSQTIYHGSTASFTLNTNNKHPKITSNCNATLNGNTLTTAALTASCQISVKLFNKVVVTAQNSSSAVANESRILALSGGAGNKTLQQASVIRAGQRTVLNQQDSNAVLAKQTDGSYKFSASRSGRYQFDFIDAESDEQVSVNFDVQPYVAFTSSKQPGQVGLTTTLSIFLSDEAIDYPVTVKFLGMGLPTDLTELSILQTDNRRKDYRLTPIQADKVQLTLLRDGLQNAVLGTPANHEVLLQTTKVPLAVFVDIKQNNISTNVIKNIDGQVRLTASQHDNQQTSYSFENSQLGLSANGAVAEFNPLTIAAGTYDVLVKATDVNGRTGQYTAKLRIIESCPIGDCSNIGNSGIPASANTQSSFNERLPLCPQQTENNRVASCTADTSGFIEAPAGYQLSLGAVSGQQSWSSGQFGVALNANSVLDAGYSQVGFKVNFDITDLDNPGEAVPVMIPLPKGTTIPENAVWRKFVQQKWQNFVVDAANKIDSAKRDSSGLCPSVAADTWQTGLITGHECIRLTITDGGPNDDDGLTNSVIRDPGVLATVQSYQLSFDTAGAEAIAPKTIAFGQPITAPSTPTKLGYTFVGWSPALPETMPANNVSVTAQWSINKYTVNFESNGGSAVTAATYNFATPVTAPTVPTRTGYTFAGWSPTLPAMMPANNVSVTAQWTINQYTVSFDSNGGTAVSGALYNYASPVAVPATPTRDGYTFAGWSPALPATMPANNVSVTAQWTINQYSVNFESNGGSAVAATTYNFAAPVTAPTVPTRTGYTFAGWSPALPATMPAANVSVTAQWTINQYTLSFDSNGGSTVSGITYNYAAPVATPAVPTRDGYSFDGWSPALPATMPAQDVKVTAKWRISSYQGETKGGSVGWLGLAGLALLALRRQSRWALALLPLSISAQAADWYGSVELGHANTSVDAAKLQQQLADAGISAKTTVDQQSRAGHRLALGYQINQWLAVEAGWVSLGKIYSRFDEVSANGNPASLYDAMPQSGDGAELSLVTGWDLNNGWRPSLRVGAWHNQSDYRLQSPESAMKNQQNSTLLVIGAGLGYQMSERWTVKLQVSQYNTDHYRTRLWSAGAEFRF